MQIPFVETSKWWALLPQARLNLTLDQLLQHLFPPTTEFDFRSYGFTDAVNCSNSESCVSSVLFRPIEDWKLGRQPLQISP